jgi:hypothetical protein
MQPLPEPEGVAEQEGVVEQEGMVEQEEVDELEPDPVPATATAGPSSNGFSGGSDTAEFPTNGFPAVVAPSPELAPPGSTLIEAVSLPLAACPEQPLGLSFEADITL